MSSGRISVVALFFATSFVVVGLFAANPAWARVEYAYITFAAQPTADVTRRNQAILYNGHAGLGTNAKAGIGRGRGENGGRNARGGNRLRPK